MFGKSVRIIFMLIVFACFGLYGQNNFFALIKDKESNKPLEGANVYISGLQKGASSDSSGAVRIDNIPAGTWQITFSFVGYHEEEREFVFPIQEDGLIIIYMEHAEEELEEVVVRSTRGSRTIADEPERVEYIGGEELDEKISMDPSNLTMVLNESPGIQVQQVSSNNQAAYFRLQGLDGKYTRLLSDGLPSYGGLESGLSLLQILPLDLQGVEIIKGSTSTLYGGGAIAGVINLISKDPKPDYWSGLLNRTSVKGTDASIYRSDIVNNFGYSVILNANYLQPYDVDHDGETEIPQGEKYSGSVKMEYKAAEGIQLNLKYSYLNDVKRSGDFNKAKPGANAEYKNLSGRNSLAFSVIYKTDGITLKYSGSGTTYNRVIELQGYPFFSGTQNYTFQEVSLHKDLGNFESVSGVSLQTEDFKESSNVLTDPRYGINDRRDANYHYITSSVFTQATTNITEAFSMTGGLRGEFNNKYSGFFMPRLALLYRPTGAVSIRLSGGLGYKLPEYFTEASEYILPNTLLPLDFNKLEAEKSRGVNLDLNYKGLLNDDIAFQFNLLTYYTEIAKPIEVVPNAFWDWRYTLRYMNIDGDIHSEGLEIALKLHYSDFSLFTAHTISEVHYIKPGITENTHYNPKHKSYIVLIYEEEEFLRLGLEAYYTGRQYDGSGKLTRDYWVFGFMAERHFKHFSVFINFENFTDTRQSRFGVPTRISQITPEDTGYVNIFAPLDGFIANAGVKLQF